MATVRNILSARSAKARVEATLKAVVQSAVYLGFADGTLEEAEVESLVDGVRALAMRVSGEANALAPTSALLDWAREAAKAHRHGGPAALLKLLTGVLEGELKRDALLVAWRVMLADGEATEGERAAFRTLATAVGVSSEECAAIEALAQAGRGLDTAADVSALEQVRGLATRGWQTIPLDRDSPHDVGVTYTLRGSVKPTTLTIELNARERVLHLSVREADRKTDPVVMLYGERIVDVVRALDAVKDDATVDAWPSVLRRLFSLSPQLFVERSSALVRLVP